MGVQWDLGALNSIYITTQHPPRYFYQGGPKQYTVQGPRKLSDAYVINFHQELVCWVTENIGDAKFDWMQTRSIAMCRLPMGVKSVAHVTWCLILQLRSYYYCFTFFYLFDSLSEIVYSCSKYRCFLIKVWSHKWKFSQIVNSVGSQYIQTPHTQKPL